MNHNKGSTKSLTGGSVLEYLVRPRDLAYLAKKVGVFLFNKLAVWLTHLGQRNDGGND